MTETISTRPLSLPRSRRADIWRGVTSARAGEITPIAYFPLLREDSIRGSLAVQVKMDEAVQPILNPIRVTVQAHLIPKSALARFDGSMEVLNRSYMGQTLPGGAAAPAWHVPDPIVGSLAATPDKGHAIFDKLGVHYKASQLINSDLLESYWTMVNWRRAALSKALPQEATNSNKLAAAFWDNDRFRHIKASFDAAMMEGAVELTLSGRMPVMGIGASNPVRQPPVSGLSYTDSEGQPGTLRGSEVQESATASAPGFNRLFFGIGTAGNPGIYADMAAASGLMSLANLEMAKKTQAWAKLRERYQGIPDEYLIDLLMQGIRVPPEDFREPVLIGMASTIIGQNERYATDYENLDKSYTNGMARLSMTINTPAVDPGGIVLVTAQIVPEQLYERVLDMGILMNVGGSADWLPNAMQDALDPQKVQVVDNVYADVLHSDPTGVFGYAPLNHGWQRNLSRVGGRFKRPVPDAFVEDRQRVWSVEKVDPSLSDDFYLCPQPFPHTVFADTTADPFEITVVAPMTVSGLTVFGAGFEEDGDHYEKIMADIDQGRVSSDDPAAAAAAAETETEESEAASEA